MDHVKIIWSTKFRNVLWVMRWIQRMGRYFTMRDYIVGLEKNNQKIALRTNLVSLKKMKWNE